MKIKKITISDFHQFQNFELDLTYPKGHEKAGQPLDKVCFIGQSGTGKTTILEMIRAACLRSENDINRSEISPDYLYRSPTIDILFNNPFQFATENTDEYLKDLSNRTNNPLQNVYYFIAGLPFLDFKQNSTLVEIGEVKEPYTEYLKKNKVNDFKFDKELLNHIWKDFFSNIKEYQTEETNFKIKLIDRAEKQNISLEIKKEMENWRDANPNPLKEIADNCLNKILNKFHLEVETEISDVRNLNIIQIKSLKNGKIVPFEKLSTGTKQIILTAFPIYYLPNGETSVILMDEPENSLYPDIQKELVDFYTSFDQSKGEKTQFFFATHSPMIASSFEPWEIVELKFDDEGKIYRDIYYDGENEVDNYKIDPRYLRWDDILTKVFDMNTNGNADFRPKKLTEYVILKDKLVALKKEGALKNPTDEVKKVIADFNHANDLLNGNWAKLRHEED